MKVNSVQGEMILIPLCTSCFHYSLELVKPKFIVIS